MSTKRCSKCGLLKQSDEFHSDSRKKDGKRSNCRDCQNLQMRGIYSTPKYKASRRELFQRPEVKQAEKERRENRPLEVKQRELQRKREYRQQPEVKQRSKEYNKTRSQTPEYKERRRQFELSPQHKLYKKQYHASERGKAVLTKVKARRRARKLGCYTERLPRNYRRTLIVRQRDRCIYCSVRFKEATVHLDHIFPLFLGGPDMFKNLQLICQSCNSKKQSKHPVDFAVSKGLAELADRHRKLVQWMSDKGYIRPIP